MTATVERPVAEAMTLAMGTVITHKVFGEKAQEALRAAGAETVRLEKLLSRFLPDSDISRLNNMAGRGTVQVSCETFEVLTGAYGYSKRCQGSFDVTVGPLADLWRVLKRASSPPAEPEIKKVLPLVDYTGLILNDGYDAGLKKRGQSVDLGGIGKGYAADGIIDVFKGFGVASAYTNLGGNVAVIGSKPDGSPWRVGIQHPRKPGELIGAVSVTDKSVVTSGDYRRCFIGADGKRYHHILDPKTGYPADQGLISVTVVSESSMAADALSTVLFTSGLHRGAEILKAFPGTEATLIDTDLRIHITRGLIDAFQAAEDAEIRIIS
jgi:thiamine biosynthesis lipoprotein